MLNPHVLILASSKLLYQFILKPTPDPVFITENWSEFIEDSYKVQDCEPSIFSFSYSLFQFYIHFKAAKKIQQKNTQC